MPWNFLFMCNRVKRTSQGWPASEKFWRKCWLLSCFLSGTVWGENMSSFPPTWSLTPVDCWPASSVSWLRLPWDLRYEVTLRDGMINLCLITHIFQFMYFTFVATNFRNESAVSLSFFFLKNKQSFTFNFFFFLSYASCLLGTSSLLPIYLEYHVIYKVYVFLSYLILISFVSCYYSTALSQ